MIPYLAAFYLYVCEPSHDFFDEDVPALRCSEDECCAQKDGFTQIHPTEEEENDVDPDNQSVEDWYSNTARRKE